MTPASILRRIPLAFAGASLLAGASSLGGPNTLIGTTALTGTREFYLGELLCADIDSAEVVRAIRFLEDELARDGGAPVEVAITECVASPPMIQFWCRMATPVPFRSNYVVILPASKSELPPEVGGEPPVQPQPNEPLLRPASRGVPAYDISPGAVREVVRAAMREGLAVGDTPWIVAYEPHPCFSYWRVSGTNAEERRVLSFSTEGFEPLGECIHEVNDDLPIGGRDCAVQVLRGRLTRSDCPEAQWEIETGIDRVILNRAPAELAEREGEEICIPVRYTGRSAACDRRSAEVLAIR